MRGGTSMLRTQSGRPVRANLPNVLLFDLMLSPTEALKEEITSWLKAPDPSKTHNRLLEEHHEGTGKWFLTSKTFGRWKDMPCGILWIKGIRMLPAILGKCLGAHQSTNNLLSAGNGKSVLL